MTINEHYFIFQYIEWPGYGYYDIFICNSPVYFTSQMGTFYMWKCYLLMCLLLFVETGSDSVAKTGLKLMAILLPQSPQIWIKGMYYYTQLRNAFEIMGCAEPSTTWYMTGKPHP